MVIIATSLVYGCPGISTILDTPLYVIGLRMQEISCGLYTLTVYIPFTIDWHRVVSFHIPAIIPSTSTALT